MKPKKWKKAKKVEKRPKGQPIEKFRKTVGLYGHLILTRFYVTKGGGVFSKIAQGVTWVGEGVLNL